LINFQKLQIVQAAVGAKLLHQFLMRADVADGSVFEHNDPVGTSERSTSGARSQILCGLPWVLERSLDQ
jgi:hypothetical protein